MGHGFLQEPVVALPTICGLSCMPVGRAPQRLLLRRRSESSQAVSLGLVTTELVINALKHAFAPGYDGEIVVRHDVDGAGWR